VAYCNIQVSFDTDLNNARSESAVAINPANPLNIIGASKRFINKDTYEFTLATYASFDGGISWTEGAPLEFRGGWGGISDPTLAWDNVGNAYLVALPFPPGASTQIGIAVYRSGDGGRTWSSPDLIHTSPGDDKQWAAGDNSPASPFWGNVYSVWDDLSAGTLAFARSVDNGASWIGTAGQTVGAALANDSFAPQVTVSPNGTVYVTWVAGSNIMFVSSGDGGDSFSVPAAAASGITPLTSPPLAAPNGFPELPGGTFRVLTIASCVAGDGQTFTVAWADFREGVSRIYYALTHDGGATWRTPASGQPLLDGGARSAADQQDFHPQLGHRPDGSIACAFYEFGPKWGGGPNLIDVVLAVSTNGAESFPDRRRVTDRAWDPKIDAPWSHGNSTTTFIGEYFGLAGNPSGWSTFWTDTRTGIQEMFYGREEVVGPWTGTQWTDTMPAHAVIDFYTWGWPACWDVTWMISSESPREAGPQVKWKVQVERAPVSPYFLTYHIIVTNLTSQPVAIQGRYGIFAV
jgi:hypothetical protein